MTLKLTDLFHREKSPGIEDYAPRAINAFALILVLLGDYRLYHYVYRQTGTWWLALLSVAPSAIGFVVWWELGYKYVRANIIQRSISVVMTIASMIMAGIGGWAEYVSLVSGNVVIDERMFYGLVIVLYFANVISGVAFFLVDDEIADKRKLATEEAQTRRKKKAVELLRGTLALAQQNLEQITALEKRYGTEAVRDQLQMLGVLPQSDEDGYVVTHSNMSHSNVSQPATVQQSRAYTAQASPHYVNQNPNGSEEANPF